jgi:hypothetical protein
LNAFTTWRVGSPWSPVAVAVEATVVDRHGELGDLLVRRGERTCGSAARLTSKMTVVRMTLLPCFLDSSARCAQLDTLSCAKRGLCPSPSPTLPIADELGIVAAFAVVFLGLAIRAFGRVE